MFVFDESIVSRTYKYAPAELSKEDSGKLGLFASVVGHVGDGNFHQAVFYETEKKAHQQAVADCVHKMMQRALEMEGTVSVSSVEVHFQSCSRLTNLC